MLIGPPHITRYLSTEHLLKLMIFLIREKNSLN